jgi:hypothetical protein
MTESLLKRLTELLIGIMRFSMLVNLRKTGENVLLV